MFFRNYYLDSILDIENIDNVDTFSEFPIFHKLPSDFKFLNPLIIPSKCSILYFEPDIVFSYFEFLQGSKISNKNFIDSIDERYSKEWTNVIKTYLEPESSYPIIDLYLLETHTYQSLNELHDYIINSDFVFEQLEGSEFCCDSITEFIIGLLEKIIERLLPDHFDDDVGYFDMSLTVQLIFWFVCQYFWKNTYFKRYVSGLEFKNNNSMYYNVGVILCENLSAFGLDFTEKSQILNNDYFARDLYYCPISIEKFFSDNTIYNFFFDRFTNYQYKKPTNPSIYDSISELTRIAKLDRSLDYYNKVVEGDIDGCKIENVSTRSLDVDLVDYNFIQKPKYIPYIGFYDGKIYELFDDYQQLKDYVTLFITDLAIEKLQRHIGVFEQIHYITIADNKDRNYIYLKHNGYLYQWVISDLIAELYNTTH